MKSMKWIIIWVVIVILVAVWWMFYMFNQNWWWKDWLINPIGSSSTNQEETSKTVKDYKKIWDDTFWNYQTWFEKFPKKWTFNFEFTIWAEWKLEELSSKLWLSEINLDEKFKNLTFNINWNHDFLDKNNMSLNWELKVFLNKESSSWLWDLNVTLKIAWNQFEYYLDMLDPSLLKFLGIKSEDMDSLIWYYQENKDKPIKNQIVDNMLASFIEWIKEQEWPLDEVSPENDKKIIQSFLDNNVINILEWEDLEWGAVKMKFKIDPTNLVNFLNDTWKIIWEFDKPQYDVENSHLKDLTIEWWFMIKNNLIVDSDIQTEIPIEYVAESWKEKAKLMVLKTKMKFLSADHMDFDISNDIMSITDIDNKLKLNIKWLIK